MPATSFGICPYCQRDVFAGQYSFKDEEGDIVHSVCAFSGDNKKTFLLKEKKEVSVSEHQ